MTTALDDFSSLVHLKSPDDLMQRPRYVAILDAENSKLAEVLAPYHFDEPYPCGLSSCRTPHQTGYLVVTLDDKETNIGGMCGRKIFGEAFTIQTNLQAQRTRLKYQLDLLQQVRDNRETLFARIAELLNRELGAKWAERTLRSFKEAVGHQVLTQLREKARRGDVAIEKTRLATEDERERHSAANPTGRPLQYVSEKAGELTGLEFLNQDPERLLTDLKNKLYELDAINATALSPRARKEWVDWASGIERIFDSAEEALANALRFFTQKNLDLIAISGSDEKEQKRLSLVRWSSSKNQVRAISKAPK